MSASTVITSGFGSGASPSLVLLLGFGVGAAVAPTVTPGRFEVQVGEDLDHFLALQASAEDLSPFFEVDMGFARTITVGADTFAGILVPEPDNRAAALYCKETDATTYLTPGVHLTISTLDWYVEQYMATEDGVAVIRLRKS